MAHESFIRLKCTLLLKRCGQSGSSGCLCNVSPGLKPFNTRFETALILPDKTSGRMQTEFWSHQIRQMPSPAKKWADVLVAPRDYVWKSDAKEPSL